MTPKRAACDEIGNARDVKDDSSPPVVGPPDKQMGVGPSMQLHDNVNNNSRSSTITTLAQLQAESVRPNRVISARTHPFTILDISENIQTVLLMDSNGRAFENLNVPEHIQIFSFGRAKIADKPQTLKTSEQNQAKVPNLVIGIGVNNRSDLNIPNTMQDLREINDWCTQRNKQIAWLGIPDYTTVPPEALSNIKTINNMAFDIFKEKFVATLDAWEMEISPGDKHKIHYNENSAKVILSLVVDFFGTVNDPKFQEHLIMVVDHKPLLKVFTNRSLEDIGNSRLRNLKEKTLRYRFQMIHIPGAKHKAADGVCHYPIASSELRVTEAYFATVAFFAIFLKSSVFDLLTYLAECQCLYMICFYSS